MSITINKVCGIWYETGICFVFDYVSRVTLGLSTMLCIYSLLLLLYLDYSVTNKTQIFVYVLLLSLNYFSHYFNNLLQLIYFMFVFTKLYCHMCIKYNCTFIKI